jgi:predicted nucleic acid-binding protein
MLILADTSVWVDHLRQQDPVLAKLLENGVVLIHPFVRGELALGNLRQRSLILSWLALLPNAKIATDDEVLQMIEKKQLWGKGIGWIDAHLLASTLLTQGCSLWTSDKSLATAASASAVAFLTEPRHS